MPRWPNRTVEERFWEKVDQSGDCWLWTAGTFRGDYGQFWTGSTKVSAHRFAYELMVGPIPEGMQLDHQHTCPKRCVNPAHLRPTTGKQNRENLSGPNSNSTSGFQGIYWDRRRNKWRARVGHRGGCVNVGLFSTIEEAGAAVIAKRLELFTHNDLDRNRF